MVKNIKSITGLRFLAAFYVFIFHVDMAFRTPLTYFPSPIDAIIKQGRLGVTIFFILSGFVLAYSHLKEYSIPEIKSKKYYFNFMLKRLARIYPVYIIGLLLCMIISNIIDTTPPIYIPLLSAFLLQTYIPPLALQWYDGGAWSVVNEFFFYSLFPIILPILLKINQKLILWLLLVVMTLVGTILGLGASDIISFPFPFPFEWAFFFPPARLPEFISGILTAILIFRFNWKPPFWVVLLFICISILYLSNNISQMDGVLTHNWIIIPTIVFLLGELSKPNPNWLFKSLETNTMQYLGKISYCFYITQLPLLFILDHLISTKILNQSNFFIAPILLIINLMFATVIYEFIEKKIHKSILSTYFKKDTFNVNQKLITQNN